MPLSIDMIIIDESYVQKIQSSAANKQMKKLLPSSTLMITQLNVSAHRQFADERTSQSREEIADVHGHDCQHPVNNLISMLFVSVLIDRSECSQ